MSYDALVWLLVGFGIGVAGSLMLLIGYSTLEYGRLSRRFRRARAAALAAAAPTPAPAAAPVAPKTSLLAGPVAEAKPAAEPNPAADDKPARPALVVVSPPEPKPAVSVEPAVPAPVVEAKPIAAPATEAVAAPPKRPQSVEAMFAEAFANDRLTVSPEPDESVGTLKPGVEKPPA